MAELVADCPRCGSQKMTFEVLAHVTVGRKYDWQRWHEAFCKCRHCHKTTTFVVSDNETTTHLVMVMDGLAGFRGVVNDIVGVEGHLSLKDEAGRKAPDSVPEAVKSAFVEGAACLAIKRPNAAATMFRLSIDLATRDMGLAAGEGAMPVAVRAKLGRRLAWLFEKGLLPENLRELSVCIREDGNDGAHAGSLSVEDAEDVADFCEALLERLFSEPARIERAKERREDRRSKT